MGQNLWLDAFARVAEDPTAPVRCPVCANADLRVIDATSPGDARMERWLCCPTCCAKNAMLMRKT